MTELEIRECSELSGPALTAYLKVTYWGGSHDQGMQAVDQLHGHKPFGQR